MSVRDNDEAGAAVGVGWVAGEGDSSSAVIAGGLLRLEVYFEEDSPAGTTNCRGWRSRVNGVALKGISLHDETARQAAMRAAKDILVSAILELFPLERAAALAMGDLVGGAAGTQWLLEQFGYELAALTGTLRDEKIEKVWGAFWALDGLLRGTPQLAPEDRPLGALAAAVASGDEIEWQSKVPDRDGFYWFSGGGARDWFTVCEVVGGTAHFTNGARVTGYRAGDRYSLYPLAAPARPNARG